MDYAMDNTQTLSPQPSIDEALEFLGMSKMDKAMGITALLKISNDDGLPLFFDEKLVLVPTSVKYGDQYDDEGEFLESLLIDPDKTREFLSGHILANFQLHMTSNNSFDLIVNKIIRDDDSYYIYQDDGTPSEGVSIEYEKFYFERAELITYKTEYHSRFNERDIVKAGTSKPESVQAKRITAFKYWLVGNSEKSIHKREDLQACYNSLNAPSRSEIWRQLGLMDNELFAAGKDDFIKLMGSVILIKTGTSKGRNL
jgi:hypothetical protein